MKEGFETKEDKSSFPFTELFEKLCPMYMSMGMSYDEFWRGDPTLVIPYRQAFIERRKRENHDLWMQGRYVYDALCAVYPLFRFSFKGGEIRPEPYTKEPYPTTKKEAEERKERDAKERYEEQIRLHKAQVEAMRAKVKREDAGHTH